MKNTITKNIIEHLQFLGYEVETQEQGITDRLICTHMVKTDLRLYVTNGFVHVRVAFGLPSGSKPNAELLKVIEKANEDTIVSKWYLLQGIKDPTAMAFSVDGYSIGYGREAFGTLIDMFLKEIRENLSKIYGVTGPYEPAKEEHVKTEA